MNRWSRTVFALAGGGLSAWVATGWTGRALAEDPERLPIHTLLGFGATLTLLFANSWIVSFLVGYQWASRRLRSGAAGEDARGANLRRQAVLAGVVASASIVGQFAISGLFFPQRLDSRAHSALAVVALLLQAAFLVLARRALVEQHGEATRGPS